jgi:hypothetical protein
MTVAERVTGRVSVGGETFRIVLGGKKPQSEEAGVQTNLRVSTRSTNQAGVARVTVLDGGGVISAGDELSVSVQNERLHTGTVTKTESGVGDRIRVTSFDALHQLKQTFISETFDRESASVAIRSIADTAGISVNASAPVLTRTISTSFKDVRADAALEKITKLTDTILFVNTKNTVVIGSAAELAFDLKIGARRPLSRLIETSAGARRPQYQSVQVIGNTPTSKRGREARHLISSQPVLSQAGEGQPSFIFEDDSITSQEQANSVARSLLRRLTEQQQGGFAVVVGRPRIRPFDTVVFPEQQGGSTFLVSGVEHTISERSGFTTRLELGGTGTER